MKIAYQSNTGLTLLVEHDRKTFEYSNGFRYDLLVNVGTNKQLSELEKGLLKGGYKELC